MVTIIGDVIVFIFCVTVTGLSAVARACITADIWTVFGYLGRVLETFWELWGTPAVRNLG